MAYSPSRCQDRCGMKTKAISADEVLTALLVVAPTSAHRVADCLVARNTVYQWCLAVEWRKCEEERPYWAEAAEQVVEWLELHGPVKLRANTPAGAAGYLRMALLHARATLWRQANKGIAQDLASSRRRYRIAAQQGISVEDLVQKRLSPAKDNGPRRPAPDALRAFSTGAHDAFCKKLDQTRASAPRPTTPCSTASARRDNHTFCQPIVKRTPFPPAKGTHPFVQACVADVVPNIPALRCCFTR